MRRLNEQHARIRELEAELILVREECEDLRSEITKMEDDDERRQ